MVHEHPCLGCGDPCDCNEQNSDDCGLCSYCETESLSDLPDILLDVDDPPDWLPEEDYGYRDDEGFE